MHHHIPIIIVNWNGIEDTLACMESVLEMPMNPPYHVHLVDNGSKDNQFKKLENKFQNEENVTVHSNKTNLGFTRAHINVYEEILKAQEDIIWVALLNNDTLIKPNWLKELVDTGEQHHADMITAKMLNYFDPESIDNIGHLMLNTGEILPLGHGQHSNDRNEVSENFGSSAGSCLYRKSMIEEIGFFDLYFSTGYEDAEFGLRAIVAGYKSIYAPEAICYHKKGQSVKKIFDGNYTAMIQTSIFYAYFKLVPWPLIIISLPFIFIKGILLFITNLLFLKPKFLGIMIKTWLIILTSWKAIMIQRKKARSRMKNRISIFKLAEKMTFFFWFDVKRFFRIYIYGEQSAWDKY